MTRITAASCLLSLVMVAARGYAQEPEPAPSLLVGLSSRIERGVVPVQFPVYAGFPDCGLFADGVSERMQFGTRAELPDFFSSAFGMTLGLSWNVSSATFTAAPTTPFILFDEASLRDTEVPHEFQYQAKWLSTRVQAAVTFQAADRWRFRLGPSFEYIASGTHQQTDNISPQGSQDVNGLSSQSILMESGEQYSSSSFTVGAGFSTSYDLPLSERVILQAELLVEADLTSRINEAEWRSINGGVGVAFLFDASRLVGSGSGLPTPPPVAAFIPGTDSTLPPSFPADPSTDKLHASLGLFGINPLGNRNDEVQVQLSEWRWKEHIQPASALTYSDRDSLLPDHFRQLTRDEARSFAPDSLAGLSSGLLQSHALNILGYRLRQNKSSRIRLLAVGREFTRARRRAEAIRAYLQDVWGVRPDRVKLVHESAGMFRTGGEADRATDREQLYISATPSEILAPFQITHRQKQVGTPHIRLEPSYRSERGIRSWMMWLRSDWQTVVRYTSAQAAEGRELTYDWRFLHCGSTNDNKLLTADFIVEDSLGQQDTATAVLPLHLHSVAINVERYVDLTSGETTVYVQLPPFDGSSIEPTEEMRGIIAGIARKIKEGSIVEFVGMVGDDPGTTGELTQERIEALAADLTQQVEELGISRWRITSDQNSGPEPDRTSMPTRTPGAIAVVIQEAPYQ